MSRVTHLPSEIPLDEAWRRPFGAINAVTWVIGLLMLGCTPVHAGSATAQFGVSAQVVKSCKVSADALASQAASANGTINIRCQSSTTPESPSAKADGVGSAFPSGTANVNYTVVEVAGSAGGLKIVTVDF